MYVCIHTHTHTQIYMHIHKKNRTFRVIVADSRSPRDGKFIEDLGYYDPHHNPSMVEIDVDKAVAWLDKGAQPSERAQKILNFRCMGTMAFD